MCFLFCSYYFLIFVEKKYSAFVTRGENFFVLVVNVRQKKGETDCRYHIESIARAIVERGKRIFPGMVVPIGEECFSL